MRAVYVLAVVVVASTLVAGEVARATPCEGEDQSQCTISEVRVTPCNKKKTNCRLKKNHDVNLSFDFTPNFSATELKTAAYGKAVGVWAIFEDLGVADGCPLTNCPLVAGTPNSFNYNLHIGKFLPKGVFPLKWMVWNAADESQKCCFSTTVELY